MIALSTIIFLCALLTVPLSWLLPARHAMSGVAIWTAIVITIFSPSTAGWLIGTTAATPFILGFADRIGKRGLIALIWIVILVAAFVSAQLATSILWIGSSFFTLRLIHVVADWWIGRLKAPSLPDILRYQLFLPVMVVGPIHRYQTFERQAQRRRFDASDMFTGLERILFGAFSAHVIGSALFGTVDRRLAKQLDMDSFLVQWFMSALDWIQLYFIFGGLTAVALGIGLMMGLRLEENFNQPWKAKSLLDFWSRWHMSLTNWVRDYVFRLITAISRSALLGLICAMLVIGLWHELSLYYIGWSLWQALGIVLSRLGAKYLPPERWPAAVRFIALPAAILGWLALARPVVTNLLELMS